MIFEALKSAGKKRDKKVRIDWMEKAKEFDESGEPELKGLN